MFGAAVNPYHHHHHHHPVPYVSPGMVALEATMVAGAVTTAVVAGEVAAANRRKREAEIAYMASRSYQAPYQTYPPPYMQVIDCLKHYSSQFG